MVFGTIVSGVILEVDVKGRGRYFRAAAKVSFVVLLLMAWFAPTANASSYTVTEESDWQLVIEEQTTVYIYGNSNRSCSDQGADPMLWLYAADGSLVTADDDGNHGEGQCVSSKIVAQLEPGIYAIRAGYCCSERGLGYSYGYDYELVILDYELVGDVSSTTTEPPSIGSPINLIGEMNEDGVFLDWEPPSTGNVQPERYAISFQMPQGGGWGVATGNAGDEGALVTEYLLGYSLFEGTGGLGQTYVFSIRSDNDTRSMYSAWSNQVSIFVDRPTTETTTTTIIPVTTTTEVPPSTTTLPSAPEPTIAPSSTTTTTVATTTTTTVPPTTSTSLPVPQTTTSTSTTTTVASTVVSTVVDTTVQATTTTVVPTTLPPTTTTTTLLPVTTTSSSTTTSTVPFVTTTTTTSFPLPTTVPPTPTTVVPVIPSTVEQRVSETFANLGLDSSSVDLSQIDEAEIKVIEQLAPVSADLVEAFIGVVDGEVTETEIVALVSNETFEDLSDDVVLVVVNAINESDDDVKEAFESEVDIFDDEIFNSYVAAGSKVDTGTRRTIVAAAAAAAVVAAPTSGGSGRSRK